MGTFGPVRHELYGLTERKKQSLPTAMASLIGFHHLIASAYQVMKNGCSMQIGNDFKLEGAKYGFVCIMGLFIAQMKVFVPAVWPKASKVLYIRYRSNVLIISFGIPKKDSRQIIIIMKKHLHRPMWHKLVAVFCRSFRLSIYQSLGLSPPTFERSLVTSPSVGELAAFGHT